MGGSYCSDEEESRKNLSDGRQIFFERPERTYLSGLLESRQFWNSVPEKRSPAFAEAKAGRVFVQSLAFGRNGSLHQGAVRDRGQFGGASRRPLFHGLRITRPQNALFRGCVVQLRMLIESALHFR